MTLDANKLISSSGTSEENVDDEETQNKNLVTFLKYLKNMKDEVLVSKQQGSMGY
jgi:hypothetical protein